MNVYERALALGALPVPEAVTEPPDRSYYPLFSKTGIAGNQSLAPDLVSPRARFGRGAPPTRAASRLACPSWAARARSCGAVAERNGAVISARPQARPVAATCGATAISTADLGMVNSPPSGRADWVLLPAVPLSSPAGTRIPARPIRPAFRRAASARSC